MTATAKMTITNTDKTSGALRFAYRAIYLDRDDGPEERATWQQATKAEQSRAANQVHVEHGGTAPHWAR